MGKGIKRKCREYSDGDADNSGSSHNGKSVEDELSRIFHDPGDTGSFRSAAVLFKRAKEVGIPGITRKQVDQFLQKDNAHTVHRQARRRFSRNPIYAHRIDQQWQADLADMNKESEANNGTRFILMVVDTLSKSAWAEPCKRKTAGDVSEAFKNILGRAKPRVPERLQTDDGKEFFNSTFKSLCNERGIHHFSSTSDQKAAGVERLNRTVKDLIAKSCRHRGSSRWVSVLQPIMTSYNESIHSRTKLSPNEAYELRNDPEAITELFNRYYGKKANKGPPAKEPKNRLLRVGQQVRIVRRKHAFEKGYTGNWTLEHFIVAEIVNRNPKRVYKLTDFNQRPIRGIFYREELQPIEANSYYIEKILQTRRLRGGKKEHFIKWLGWSNEFNSWINETEINKLDGYGDQHTKEHS